MNIESNLSFYRFYINNTNTFHTIPVSQHIDENRGLHFDDPVSIFFVYSCSHFSFDLELTGRGLPPWKSKFLVSESQAQKQQQQQLLQQQQQKG